MKKTTVISLITIALAGMLLTGCCIEHDWKEATCEAPRTCQKCGETEGEALGHDWREATCTDSEYCQRCYLMGAKSFGHTYGVANYQEAEACKTCGDVKAPAIAPYFAENVLAEYVEMAMGEGYSYFTSCEDAKQNTEGTCTVVAYETIESDDAHPAADGYEWKRISYEYNFSDDNAYFYGVEVGRTVNDYYDDKLMSDTAEVMEDGSIGFSVNYYGEDYDGCLLKTETEWSGWTSGRVKTMYVTYDVRVPAGYDGIMFGSYDRNFVWEDETTIAEVADENTLFFRAR